MERDLDALNDINRDYIVLEELEMRVPKRYIRDAENPIEFYSDQEFRARYRFRKNTVVEIIMPLIQWADVINNRGLPIPSILMMLSTLRFYATGNFQTVVGDLRGISQPSICRALHFLSLQLASHCRRFIHFPRRQEEFDRNQEMYYEIAEFPNVTGTIDCTHVVIKNPGGEFAEVFRNRKRLFSINVQVVVGANLNILDIVARWPGREHDSTIFNNSSVREKFERGVLRGYLLGDSGYPCLPYLMTPLQNPTTEAEIRYNRAQIRTRNTVERTFGVWKRRFPCLQRGLGNKPDRCCAIIVACAVLYNIGLLTRDNFEDGDFLENDNHEINMDAPPAANHVGFGIRRALIQRHFHR